MRPAEIEEAILCVVGEAKWNSYRLNVPNELQGLAMLKCRTSKHWFAPGERINSKHSRQSPTWVPYMLLNQMGWVNMRICSLLLIYFKAENPLVLVFPYSYSQMYYSIYLKITIKGFEWLCLNMHVVPFFHIFIIWPETIKCHSSLKTNKIMKYCFHLHIVLVNRLLCFWKILKLFNSVLFFLFTSALLCSLNFFWDAAETRHSRASGNCLPDWSVLRWNVMLPQTV